MEFKKLVRDKIPEIIIHNQEIPTTKILNDEEFKNELNKKLIEECNEVINAQNKEELLEELADILEVMDSIINFNNSSLEEVKEIQKNKREKRGGFDKRIFLIKTEEK